MVIRLRRNRVIAELDDLSIERLCEAIRLHRDGHTEGDPALKACWDADRLDLWRVRIDPDPERLCTAHACKLQVLRRANRMAEVSS